MKKENELLIRATEKLIKLSKIESFKYEILEKAPPVLWFGNKETKKPIVLTLGANPSREEFLSDNSKNAKNNIIKKIPLNYLKEKRFFHLSDKQDYESIISNIKIQDEIIKSYNNYFTNGNPYNWFGKNTPESYNSEQFIRELNASYYGGKDYQAIHIDLFPFATVSNFTSIFKVTQANIFDDKWGQSFIIELIEMLNPKFILVFGRTNYNCFTKLFDLKGIQNKFTFKKENGKTCTSYYFNLKFNGIQTIGLSTNLGNPLSFNKIALTEYGKVISKSIKY